MGVTVVACGVVGASETSVSHPIASTWPIMNSGLSWYQQFLDKSYLNAKDEVFCMFQEAV